MNTSTQHPLHLPGTPQEGDLSVAQKLQIESIQGNIKKIVGVIGDAIENLKENQRKIEEIAVACEQAEDKRLMPFAKLIQETGNVNENDSNGQTVLMSASRNGHTEIVKLLLAHPDIQVNKNNSHGDTALMNAVFYSRVDITELLLFHPGIFVNHQNSHGDTALIYAARRDHKVITKLLLAHQEIQVNEKNSNGNTALMSASSNGHTVITKLLIADPRLKIEEHDQGKTALEQAKTPEIKALIEEAMRKQGIEF